VVKNAVPASSNPADKHPRTRTRMNASIRFDKCS
jgi:hypothetical protein